MNSLTKFFNHAVYYVFLLLCVLTYFYIPWRGLTVNIFTVVFFWSLLAGLAFVLSRCRLVEDIYSWFFSVGKGNWVIWGVLAVGLLLRILWVLVFPVEQYSDFLAYWDTAVRLVETGEYSTVMGGYTLVAWRSVGYPALLSLFILIFGPLKWIPVLVNIIAYLVSFYFLYDVCGRVLSRRCVLVAVILFALWPGSIAITGFAATEPISAMLYFGVVWAAVRGFQSGWKFIAVAGVLLGLSILVRPSLQLFFIPMAVVFIVCMKDFKEGIKNIIVLGVVACAVVLPWTVRNYVQLNDFVLVSTNGGDNFYRANNPLATGGYIPKGERDLSQYLSNEAQWNQKGMEFGFAWIKENPIDFVKLGIIKQSIFLSNGAIPIEWTLKGQYGLDGGWFYKFFYGLGYLWWGVVWLLVGAALLKRRDCFVSNGMLVLVMLCVMYLVAIHAVFESQPRYNYPIVIFLVMLASAFFNENRRETTG